MTDPSKSTKMNLSSDPRRSSKRQIRVRSEDSAFIYNILEASNGVCAYSTLSHQAGDRHRDLELVIPEGFETEVDRILADLHTQLSGELHVLSISASDSASEPTPTDRD